LEFFKEAIAKDPQNTMAWNGLGYCFVGMNNPKDAVNAYQQAIKFNPTDETLHFTLGNYYIKLGRQQQAIESFRKAITINPTADPNYASAYYNLGYALFQKGEKAAALDE
jgi:tetratricopeptide (TPR) repeat protein